EQQSGVEIVAPPAEPEQAVREQKAEMVLVIDSDFAEKFNRSSPAGVHLLSDSTSRTSAPKVKRLMALLRGFSSQTAGLRLITGGISPEAASVLKIDDVDIANLAQRAARVLGTILIFLALGCVTGAMPFATDSTAGERERGSLEPLLINPVPRWQIAAGKWLAAAAAGFAVMIATLAFVFQALSKLPLEDLGIRLSLGPGDAALLVATMGPLALLAPAVLVF